MALSARFGSNSRLRWRAVGSLFEALEAAAIAPPAGARFASGGSGGGGGGGGGRSDAKRRAEHYAREKERKQQGREEAGQPSSSSDKPRSRLAEAAAEFSEAQQALFLSSPSGLGVGAEAAIAQAIKDGAFDNLAGKGKPLRAEDHTAQFGRVDPLVAAVTRTMGGQGVKPLSLELQEEVRRDLAALRQQLDQELRAALAASVDSQQPSSSSSSSSSSNGSSSSGGWLGRWFGGGGGGTAAPAPASRRHTVASIRAGEHAALRHAADELQGLVRQYNNAVLADKEAFGSFWPLDRMRQLDWAAEVEAALARICGVGSGSGGSGGGGGSEQKQ